MKKTLLALGILMTLIIGSQTTFAACPCSEPCPSMACPAAPCDCACPAAPCEPCCDECNKCCKKKCKWWKIFENKCCCEKCNKCYDGCTCKRCHWWKFWEDRRCVHSSKCDKCCD